MHPHAPRFAPVDPPFLPATCARVFTAYHRQAFPLRASRALVWLLACLGIAAGHLTSAQAQRLGTLIDFTRGNGINSAPVLGRDGNIYGTRSSGGSSSNLLGNGGGGTVYRVAQVPNGSITIPRLSTLGDFGNGGTNGGAPNGLTEGTDGNFYGTTSYGGKFGFHTEGSVMIFGPYGGGTVFRVTSGGELTTLYRFTGEEDGGGSRAPLTQGPDGSFYGTTARGGTGDHGTVFRLTPNGNGGVLTTLHRFSGGADGNAPTDKLAQGADGNLYGATPTGGAYNGGAVFRVSPGGEFTVLHSFGGGDDGASPSAPAQGLDGNFYGVTKGPGLALGTVYRVTPTGEFATIHRFSGEEPDGKNPNSPLVLGSDGNFYGSTNGGLIQVTPAGAVQTLYTFRRSVATGEYSAGEAPEMGLAAGPGGVFYGVTQLGGLYDQGTLFALTVPLGAEAPAGVSLRTDATVIRRGAGQVATVTFTRLGNLTKTLRVAYQAGGTAVAGRDYVPLSGIAKIKAGKATATVSVTPRPGGSNGQVKLVLPPADAYTVQGANQLKVKIVD